MAESSCQIFLSSIIFLFCFEIVICKEQVIEYEDKKRCTYFEDERWANFEPGMVNCSWYVSSSCCKRTEVTSVFSSNMLPLYRASTECRNRMNYLMCYFCSPDQYLWYKEGKVHICEQFCVSIHNACADAYYDGTRIGEVYSNGTSFCEAQDFKVVNSKYCFKYDPTVFDSAVTSVPSCLLLMGLTLVAWLNK